MGELVGDRYRIDQVYGDGALGRTYLAVDEDSGERCALKVMYGDYAGAARQRRRFVREIEVGSRLCAPNVLGVVDAGETAGGLPYLVTVHLEGQSLSALVRREAPLDGRRVAALAADIAAGLAHMHGSGLLHRGLCPEAVLVCPAGVAEQAVIVDFDRAIADGDEVMGRLTRMSTLRGDVTYMSPEQIMDHPVDERSDLYVLGLLIYTMLAGRPPFVGPQASVVRAQLSNPPPAIVHPRWSPVACEVEAIAGRLLAKRPSDRYQTAVDLLASLDASKLSSL